MSIPVFKPMIRRKEMDAVLSCLVDETIAYGNVSRRFVRSLAQYIGCSGGFAFKETYRGISTILKCLEIEIGGRIILSPLAPSVYVQAIIDLGLKPLYADVSEDDALISNASIQKLLQFDPKAIILSTTLGYIPDIEEIMELNLPLIEDISEGFGGNTGSKKAGSYGDFTILSLEPDKIISSAGGCVILGKGKKELNQMKKNISIYEDDMLLPNMNSSLGYAQFEGIENSIEKRKEIAQLFISAVQKSRHTTLFQKGEGENIFYSFPVLLSTGMKDAEKYASRKGVGTVSAFENACINLYQIEETPCPVAQSLLLRCLLFPLYPTLGAKNTELIIKILSTLP